MRKRITAPVFAVLLTATLGSATPPRDPPECVVAAAWVRAHHSALPTTLAEVSRYPIVYRRAIYDALPGDVRAGLWREQLEGFLRSGQRLSAAQRAAVREAIAQLPALTAPGADGAAGRRLGQHLSTLFDRATVRRVFVRLGPPPAAAPAKAKRPGCDCNTIEDFGECGEGYTCTYYPCNSTNTGCGPFWSGPCDGFCRAA
jgi:hypothetical protein